MSYVNKILDYFYLLKKHDTLGTSYLFLGEEFSPLTEIIKLITCKEDARSCNQCWDCKRIDELNHPDIFSLSPDPTTIKIEAIRESQRSLSLKSFRLSKKVLIINGAEHLGADAANAFLKTLEEPPKDSFIAVCASGLDGLLPTIISRCRKIYLPQASERQTDRRDIANINQFLSGQRLKFTDRREFSSFLWGLITLLRDRMIAGFSQEIDNKLFIGHDQIKMKPYSVDELSDTLGELLRIYSGYKNINMNLAFDLIESKLA